MPQHELEHCDICHKLNAKGVIFCERCDVAICKECSESKENYFAECENGDFVCNECAKELEAWQESQNEEVFKLCHS